MIGRSDVEARLCYLEGLEADLRRGARGLRDGVGQFVQDVATMRISNRTPSIPTVDLTCCEVTPLDGSVMTGYQMTLTDGTNTITLDRAPEVGIGMSMTPAPFGVWGAVAELPLASTTPTVNASNVAGFGGTTAVRFEFYDPDAVYEGGGTRPAPPRVCHLRLYVPTNPSGTPVRGVAAEDFYDAYSWLYAYGTGAPDPPFHVAATPDCEPFGCDFAISTGTFPQVNSFNAVYGKSKTFTVHIEEAP